MPTFAHKHYNTEIMRHFSTTIIAATAAMLLLACSKDEMVTVDSIDITSQDDDRTTQTIDSSYTYQLPVIFHVLYTGSASDSVRALASRLPNILNKVNELYKGNVYGWRDVYSENINVNFVLANSDESGNALSKPGVEFNQWKGSFPIEASSFMASKNNTQLIWEPNEYINVMVYPFEQNTKGSIILGMSHMPYTLNDSTRLDGLEQAKAHYISKNNLAFPYCVSINSDYLYRESTRYDDAEHGKYKYTYDTCDIVATLAHELGHYLGLHHVFTEEQKSSGSSNSYTEVDDCFDSDFCDDTPSYNKVAYNDSLKQAPNGTTMQQYSTRHSCDGTTFESDNIMDYSIGYAFQFTKQQKERMRHVLYYSPLIPGPKINHTNVKTRATKAEEGIIDLPIVISE